jgi:hypothetical protein
MIPSHMTPNRGISTSSRSAEGEPRPVGTKASRSTPSTDVEGPTGKVRPARAGPRRADRARPSDDRHTCRRSRRSPPSSTPPSPPRS